ncbi:DUF4238 domain-containing protein [Cypionkella sinensis]|uniref:DUF4238 domain-containing protein n=1 Tax=Cypionkella sinensis TaxID=1756043 RepID=A0ABV7J127_9RHOB
MTNRLPPRSVKENQHFVPRSWLSRFAGQDGRVLAIKDGKDVTQIAVADIMSGDWIYTVFDEWWRPSDELEDALSIEESRAAKLFESLHTSPVQPNDKGWIDLCHFLALTVCRHPDTMQTGHTRSKELAWHLADVRAFNDAAAFFGETKQKFGVDLSTAEYQRLLLADPSNLIAEAEEVEHLTPQDPKLPEQISLSAVNNVATQISVLNLFLLDAPKGANYVLSDRPMPLHDLAFGFTVPLSKNLALLAMPGDGREVIYGRREATPEMVALVNTEQADRMKSVIIGPDRAVLESLF